MFTFSWFTFSFILLTHEEGILGFLIQLKIFRKWRQGSFRLQIPHTPAYAVQLLRVTLYQHSQQYRMAKQS